MLRDFRTAVVSRQHAQFMLFVATKVITLTLSVFFIHTFLPMLPQHSAEESFFLSRTVVAVSQ